MEYNYLLICLLDYICVECVIDRLYEYFVECVIYGDSNGYCLQVSVWRYWSSL